MNLQEVMKKLNHNQEKYKFGLIGSHGVGKTTLLTQLVKRFIKENIDCYIITDTARRCPFNLNKRTDFKSQIWIFNEQIKRELIGSSDIILSDRTVLDILAYSKYAMKNGNMKEQEYETIKKLVEDWIYSNPYFFLYVPIPEGLWIEDDGVRDTDKAYQKEIDDYILEALEELNIKYVVLKNGGKQKLVFDEIVNLINKNYSTLT
jgi:thymidylate kinase